MNSFVFITVPETTVDYFQKEKVEPEVSGNSSFSYIFFYYIFRGKIRIQKNYSMYLNYNVP